MTMNSTYLLSVIALTFFVIGCTPTNNQNTNNLSYSDSLNIVRKKINKEYKNNSNSPILDTERERFTGLKHFPASESWKVKSEVILFDTLSIVKMATSKGKLRDMIPFAKLKFRINDEIHELTGYSEVNSLSQELFIPFYDATNGIETYSGGRYVDAHLNNNDSIFIDFNNTYNPYCHYNHNYSCPIPPIENALDIKVTAGEKLLY